MGSFAPLPFPYKLDGPARPSAWCRPWGESPRSPLLALRAWMEPPNVHEEPFISLCSQEYHPQQGNR